MLLNKEKIVMKRIIPIFLLIVFTPVLIIKGQEPSIKREITLYNPYKPSLPDVVKKSFLPDMTDTVKVKPDIRYDIKTYPFTPPYAISPLKPATMVPDPLTKLYNSFINFGIGNYLTPLAEISITSLRSKKGTAGLYASHFSTNGKVKLDDDSRVFAGYMDNNISLYGKKFLNESVLKGSVDFKQMTRYAYGYDTDTLRAIYHPSKKDVRLDYFTAGASTGISSMKQDSSELSYDINAGYVFFHSNKNYYQHNLRLNALASKEIKGFYAGSGLEIDYSKPSDTISSSFRLITSLSPFLKKKTSEWDVKIGAKLLFDKFFTEEYSKLHIYPDIRFGFNIIPSYLGFFAELSGKLEKNTPEEVVLRNPYILPDEKFYRIPNTSYPLIVKTGVEGETGIEGRYRLNVSYSFTDENYLLFSGYLLTAGNIAMLSGGNYFIPVYDEAEILNIHGEMTGKINRQFSFYTEADYFKYNLASSQYAWGKPAWQAKFDLKYNLRDKIIAAAGLTALGERKFIETINNILVSPPTFEQIFQRPSVVNLNISAEYRYTKILSFWLKFNNISFSRYYEWAFYPSLRFMCMAGFTYSL